MAPALVATRPDLRDPVRRAESAAPVRARGAALTAIRRLPGSPDVVAPLATGLLYSDPLRGPAPGSRRADHLPGLDLPLGRGPSAAAKRGVALPAAWRRSRAAWERYGTSTSRRTFPGSGGASIAALRSGFRRVRDVVGLRRAVSTSLACSGGALSHLRRALPPDLSCDAACPRLRGGPGGQTTGIPIAHVTHRGCTDEIAPLARFKGGGLAGGGRRSRLALPS